MTEQECDILLNDKGLKRLSAFNGSTKKISIRCVCGTTFSTTPKNIKSGNTRSCGCYKIQRTKETKIKDLVGRKFGRLTVKHYTKTVNRKMFWMCECECGKTKEVRGNSLKSQMIISCGCAYHKGVGGLSRSYWTRIVKRAATASIPLEITIEYVWQLFQKQDEKCALTGLNIKLVKFYNTQRKEQTASLDRIDSSKGYIVGNVQWVQEH